jgi:hypothetical protein
MRRLYATWGIMAVLVLGGQAMGQGPRPLAPLPPPGGGPAGPCSCAAMLNGRTVVFVVDGVTGLSEFAANLEAAYIDTRFCPPVIRTINWTRSDSTAKDYRDRNAQIAGAAKLLLEVKRVHDCNPGSPVVLMGYCAGAQVVLMAAEQMPPGYVDRIFLFAPAVSSCYDIRPAIRASKQGMDVLYNSDDTVLEFYEEQYGTTDGMNTTTAGTTGFKLPRTAPYCKDPIFCLLRQIDASNLNALGGHYATITSYFLQRNVLPYIPCGSLVQVIPQTPPPPPGVPPGPPYGPPPTVPPPGPPAPPLPRVPPPAPYGTGGGAGNLPPPPVSIVPPSLPPPTN